MNTIFSIVSSIIVFIIVIITALFCKNSSKSSLYELFGGNKKCNVENCSFTHRQDGLSYPWLKALGHGKLLKVEFNEAGVTKGWQIYTKHWWDIHCKAISHNPEDLKKAHIKVFVGPNAPIKLRFYFEDGTITAPTEEFYDLEEEYFKKNNICA
jgi:hypothetical protein